MANMLPFPTPDDGVPQLITALAAKLRDPSPSVRAMFAERLVRACDRYDRPIEQVIAKEFNQAWRPPVPAPTPPRSPMGKMNWLSWCRFMLHHELTDWERTFIASVMKRRNPSKGQREKLREVLLKIYPGGCGGWGMPD